MKPRGASTFLHKGNQDQYDLMQYACMPIGMNDVGCKSSSYELCEREMSTVKHEIKIVLLDGTGSEF